MSASKSQTLPVAPSLAARGRETFRLLFGTPLNASLTVLFGGLLLIAVPPVLRWSVLDAVWFDPDPASCRAAAGACWNFVYAKLGQLLFGIYPYELRWRPGLACALLVGLLAWSVRPASWSRNLALVWLGALFTVFVLMGGGLGFPLGILLALGRRSTLPALRICCVIFIESVRGLPLLSILFVASIMLPLFLPESLLPDKFTRALVALTLFASAYFAEVVRGGLQAIPKGQFEAASSLALPFWKTQRTVILPQAIRIVIPALANTVIVMIKNTSLVMVVGLFDIISSGKAALADPAWPSPAAETFLFIGGVFFTICFAFARFADFLERRGKTSH